jgi:outer membrane protein assembly factor BamB
MRYSDRGVYAVAATTGTEQWSFQTDGLVRASPVIKNGTVYVAGGNMVYALESSDTEKR